MNWEIVRGICEVAGLGGSAFFGYLALQRKENLATLKLWIEERLTKQDADMRVWINGSFDRSALVDEKFRRIEAMLQVMR